MKFARLPGEGRDGRLVIGSRDLTRALDAADLAPSLLDAIEHWDRLAPQLQARSDALNAGRAESAFEFERQRALAPLPRAPQWCDASAFLNHGRLREQAFTTPPIPLFDTVPVLFAPVAITPDELGDGWSDSRVKLDLHVEWNGERFGAPNGREMNFGFDALIAHAARTRRLRAGTVIGSGMVSNAVRAAGSACIAERRVIEMIDAGAATTGFMRFGDRIRMAARDAAGATPFGVIDQGVVEAGRRVPTL